MILTIISIVLSKSDVQMSDCWMDFWAILSHFWDTKYPNVLLFPSALRPAFLIFAIIFGHLLRAFQYAFYASLGVKQFTKFENYKLKHHPQMVTCSLGPQLYKYCTFFVATGWGLEIHGQISIGPVYINSVQHKLWSVQFSLVYFVMLNFLWYSVIFSALIRYFLCCFDGCASSVFFSRYRFVLLLVLYLYPSFVVAKCCFAFRFVINSDLKLTVYRPIRNRFDVLCGCNSFDLPRVLQREHENPLLDWSLRIRLTQPIALYPKCSIESAAIRQNPSWSIASFRKSSACSPGVVS